MARDPLRDGLLADGLAVARESLAGLDLEGRVLDHLRSLVEPPPAEGSVDLVAVGKAASEMTAAARAALGPRVARTLVIGEAGSAAPVVGDHPTPGARSARAGSAILAFLDAARAATTVFLVSGGASALAVAPVDPVTLEDLGALYNVATSRGAGIVTLNRLRAAVSWLGGGAVLTRVRADRSIALLSVDVIAGAPWVASALTYDYRPDEDEVAELLDAVGLSGSALGERVLAAATARVGALGGHVAHENVVVLEPADWLAAARAALRRRGYRVVDLGAELDGDVGAAARRFAEVLERAGDGPVALVGVGELTVALAGAHGRGGRCQEWAARVSLALPDDGRPTVALGFASDGRDHFEGVAGAWTSDTTLSRARAAGLDVAGLLARHDIYAAHEALDQLVAGGHTGANLCDLYLVVAGAG